jgi:alpha-D-ribose 1-methylphosphonate 5-phosphate C-P lyase
MELLGSGVDGVMSDDEHSDEPLYTFGFIDEDSKREVRRKPLKAVALPGTRYPSPAATCPSRVIGAPAACG